MFQGPANTFGTCTRFSMQGLPTLSVRPCHCLSLGPYNTLAHIWKLAFPWALPHLPAYFTAYTQRAHVGVDRVPGVKMQRARRGLRYQCDYTGSCNAAANYVCGPPLSGPITIKTPRYPDLLSPTPPPRTTHSPSTGSESDDESGSTTASETSFRSTHSDYPYNDMSMVGAYHLNGQGTPRAYFDKYFNPVESLVRTMNRFISIPLINGVFDGQGRYTPTISYTQHFAAPLEYSDEQVSVPFTGHFPPVYVGTALIQLGIAFRDLKEYQRRLCDADGLSRSQLLSRYLPNIYRS
ncbi:hypothetical protein L210DRAFT_3631727 [Boletus edulis BED1]|uniref:Uncharacterized protein n=1 Tax=Boletus edulis BED1 TaxID=1328754 RepID=A0AAD4BQJ4_BOLED|nr:hypothetical protein L210DRAFT_3631727 [Boletus edulis BED1]